MTVVFATHPYVRKDLSPGNRWVREMDATMRRKLAGPLRRELEDLRERVEIGKLESAVRAQNVGRVVELSRVNEVGSIVGSLGNTLEDPMARGANLAMQELGRAGIAVDMYRPRFERWLDKHAAALVREVNGTSRAAVRKVLVEGIKQGRHPRALARDLRAIVGLTEPQSIRVERLRQSMLEAGVTEAKVQQRTAKFAERLLKERAQMIAQNETMVAINSGRHQLWLQLQADGDLEPGAQRQWYTAIDEAVCPICEPMHEQVTTITGAYTTPGGREVDHPPAHVRCRCTELLI